MTSSLCFNFFITVPSLSRVTSVDAEQSETVESIINRVLASFGISEHTNWSLFVVGKSYVKIDGKLPCSSILLSDSETIVLRKCAPRTIHVFCDGKSASFDVDQSKPLCTIIPSCIRVFHLVDEDSYFFMDPFTYTIESIDNPPLHDVLVFKPYLMKDKELFFTNGSFPESATVKSLPLVSTSKLVFKSQFKAFTTTLKSLHGEFHILDLSEDKILSLLKCYETNTGITTIPEDEQVTLLFTLLASLEEPLLSPSLSLLARKIVQEKDQRMVFKSIYCLLSMLNFSSHCVLMEICQSLTTSFPTSTPSSKNTVLLLFQELLFKHQPPSTEELLFSKYVAFFGSYLMHLPGIKNVRSMGNKIGIFLPNENFVFMLDGEKKKEKETQNFDFVSTKEDFFEFTKPEKTGILLSKSIDEANQKLVSLQNSISKSVKLIENKTHPEL